MSRTLPIAALTATLTAVAVLVIAGPASAHNVVTGTSPIAGETVTELPAAYSVTTSEPMLQLGGDAAFGLEVTDASGQFYGDGCLTVADNTMSMGATAGEPGDYTVTWQIVSEDGHPEGGSFAFTWAPAPDAPTVAGAATPPVCGETATPSASPTPEPTATATDTPRVEHHADDSGGELLPWGAVVGIGLAVLAAAIGIAVVLVRRNRAPGPPSTEDKSRDSAEK